jgi:hypothetical protein
MKTETLPNVLSELDRYLVPDDLEPAVPAGLTPDPERIEIEMQVRLGDGTQVSVVERVGTMPELGPALERARVRLATALARGALEGFGR